MCNINQTGFASFSIIMILPTQHFTKKQPNSPKKQIHKKNLQGLHANPWLMLLRWIILTSRCAHYTPDNARFSPSRTLMHQHCGLTHQRCRSRQKRHGIEGYRSPSAKWTTVYSSKGFSIKYLSPINVNILPAIFFCEYRNPYYVSGSYWLFDFYVRYERTVTWLEFI